MLNTSGFSISYVARCLPHSAAGPHFALSPFYFSTYLQNCFLLPFTSPVIFNARWILVLDTFFLCLSSSRISAWTQPSAFCHTFLFILGWTFFCFKEIFHEENWISSVALLLTSASHGIPPISQSPEEAEFHSYFHCWSPSLLFCNTETVWMNRSHLTDNKIDQSRCILNSWNSSTGSFFIKTLYLSIWMVLSGNKIYSFEIIIKCSDLEPFLLISIHKLNLR